jgi:hypothetical protein
MSGDVRDFNNIETWAVIIFGKVLKEIHAIMTETLGEHALSYATIKNWVAQFKQWFFHLLCTSFWTTWNSDHPGGYWSNSRANLGRPLDFG